MTLYVVATPIGNLEDVSKRMLRTLELCDICAAEDTRHTGIMLKHFGIQTRMMSYHEYSSTDARQKMLELLQEGKNIALVTDAGTPCISDPGYQLVRDARALGVAIEVVPGPSAVVAFLSGAGLPTDSFLFVGFLPTKTKARQEALQGYVRQSVTIVAYESPKRLKSTLEMLEDCAPDAEIVVARELTKMHETWVQGSAADVKRQLDEQEGWRGEIVVGISPKKNDAIPEDDEVSAWIAALVDAGLGTRAVAQVLSERLQMNRKDIYQRVLDHQRERTDV